MEQAVIGTGGEGKLPALRPKRTVLVWAVAGVLIIIVAVIALLVWHQKSKPTDTDDAIAAGLKASQTAYGQGAYDVALADLNGLEQKATKKSDKIAVYDQLASIYTTQGTLDKAVQYYGLKHTLDPGSAKKDANVLGSIYERMGDNQKAIEQYQLALQYRKSLPNVSGRKMDIDTLQGQIESLQGDTQ
ncbi:MAG TPA: tetratricopeptide repeat protein [Candidatus Saccharimonadales bacterium]|nr:tetratricopeptide repeat protein [Candidatus Saccharimonadales bacterium]